MDIKEMKIKPENELKQTLAELKKKLDDLKFKVVQRQLKNIREIRSLKKDIARIMFVLSRKKPTK